MRRFIDLSVPLDNDAKEPFPPHIEYQNHRESLPLAARAFGIQESDWPEGKAWAAEEVTLTTHTGTHVDAPYHYWDTTAGKPAKTIDELPLEWFYGPGVLLDFTHKHAGEEISREEVEAALERISHTLVPGEIVLVRTGCDRLLFEPGFMDAHPGMSAEATRYLIECGIRVMGTDAYGWDVPFPVQGEQFRATGNPDVLWAAHYVGKELEYCQIEKLANLDKIPSSTGFTVVAFPVKLARASASWVRPVAIVDED
jgi:kynurenine formamidase